MLALKLISQIEDTVKAFPGAVEDFKARVEPIGDCDIEVLCIDSSDEESQVAEDCKAKRSRVDEPKK